MYRVGPFYIGVAIDLTSSFDWETFVPDYVCVEVVTWESSHVAGEDFVCDGPWDILVWAVCTHVEAPVGTC